MLMSCTYRHMVITQALAGVLCDTACLHASHSARTRLAQSMPFQLKIPRWWQQLTIAYFSWPYCSYTTYQQVYITTHSLLLQDTDWWAGWKQATTLVINRIPHRAKPVTALRVPYAINSPASSQFPPTSIPQKVKMHSMPQPQTLTYPVLQHQCRHAYTDVLIVIKGGLQLHLNCDVWMSGW